MSYGLNTRPFHKPLRPIALRTDLIAERHTRLHMIPACDSRSETDYIIRDDMDDEIVCTVTGKKFGGQPGREFRDKSGLPLFELHQKSIVFKQPWTVRLPGCGDKDLVTTHLRRNFRDFGNGNCDLIFENAAAIQNKHTREKMMKLQTYRRQSMLYAFDVLDGDRKVVEVQESVQKNERLALMPESRKGYHPILDIRVAPGVDLTLVRFLIPHKDVADLRRLVLLP